MDRRYQVFLIARVRPYGGDSPRYRCIAASHDQYCKGKLSVLATLRVVCQIKQLDNAQIIESEIAAIQGKYWHWEEDPIIPDVPCPYTSFLVGTNWSADLEDPHHTRTCSFFCPLEADMGSMAGDNYDGISVIDVTDPLSPSYCHVFWHQSEPVPLSGHDYCRIAYPGEHNHLAEEDVQATIAQLESIKLIRLEMLAEAWPTEYAQSPDSQLSKDVKFIDNPPDANSLPSVADFALCPAVVQAATKIRSADIEAILWTPDIAALVKATLREHWSALADGAVALLKIILEKELESSAGYVDLTGFDLSSGQVTINAVRDTLTHLPHLRRVALNGCPMVTSDDLRDLLSKEPKLFYNVEALIHPLLLQGFWDKQTLSCPYENAFSYVGFPPSYNVTACSLPFFTPTHIIRALIDCLLPLGKDEYYTPTSPVVHAAFASVRSDGQKWSQRTTIMVPKCSLGAFSGEGWVFASDVAKFREEGGHYAFLRFGKLTAESVNEAQAGGGADDTTSLQRERTWEIHDLPSFLEEMHFAGRPPPAQGLVKQLTRILNASELTPGWQKRKITPFSLMRDEHVSNFLERLGSRIEDLKRRNKKITWYGC